MPRAATGSDFVVDVNGEGKFIFARRDMKDQFRIRGQYAELTGGHFDQNGTMMDIAALAYATIQVLMVKAPEGFSLEKLDPLEESVEDCENRIIAIWGELRSKEGSFRRKPAEDIQAASQGPAP